MVSGTEVTLKLSSPRYTGRRLCARQPALKTAVWLMVDRCYLKRQVRYRCIESRPGTTVTGIDDQVQRFENVPLDRTKPLRRNPPSRRLGYRCLVFAGTVPTTARWRQGPRYP